MLDDRRFDVIYQWFLNVSWVWGVLGWENPFFLWIQIFAQLFCSAFLIRKDEQKKMNQNAINFYKMEFIWPRTLRTPRTDEWKYMKTRWKRWKHRLNRQNYCPGSCPGSRRPETVMRITKMKLKSVIWDQWQKHVWGSIKYEPPWLTNSCQLI